MSPGAGESRITGREYRLFEYFGHPDAERAAVPMGSGTEAARDTVEHLSALGERVGALQVHLYRPFSAAHFLAALPPTVRSLAVLDRTKEPGATGEPLALFDTMNAAREGELWGRLKANSLTPARRRIYAREHTGLVAATRDRDTGRAARAMSSHLESVRRHLLK